MSTANLTHRFAYHPPQDDQTVSAHENTRDILGEVAVELDFILPEGREKSLVFTKIEEAMFWANAAIARAVKEPVPTFEVGDRVVADLPGSSVIAKLRCQVATVVEVPGCGRTNTYDLQYPNGALQWALGRSMRLATPAEDEVVRMAVDDEEEFEIAERPLEVGDEIITTSDCCVTTGPTRATLTQVDRVRNLGGSFEFEARFPDGSEKLLERDEFERVSS